MNSTSTKFFWLHMWGGHIQVVVLGLSCVSFMVIIFLHMTSFIRWRWEESLGWWEGFAGYMFNQSFCSNQVVCHFGVPENVVHQLVISPLIGI